MKTETVRLNKNEKAIEIVFSNRYKLSHERAKEFLKLLEQESARTTNEVILDYQKRSKFYFDARWGEGWEVA